MRLWQKNRGIEGRHKGSINVLIKVMKMVFLCIEAKEIQKNFFVPYYDMKC